jgi:hypothetical protein
MVGNRRSARLAIVVAAILACAAVAVADEPQQDTEAQAAEDGQVAEPAGEPGVFDNAYLERRFGPVPTDTAEAEDATGAPAEPPAPVSGEAPAGEGWDPLKDLQDEQRKEAQQRERLASAEAKVAAAEQKIADLEQRMLRVRNPLLPRPETPEQDTQEWEGMDNGQRVERTRRELDVAREELRRAQNKLEEARRGD